MSGNALQYAGGRYLWIAIGLLAASFGLYWLQEETTPPSGGTWQGLTLGIVAGLLIFWLNYLGVRKRRYGQGGSLKGWVSAHVYLGTALIGVSLFHSAGQLGWNIHSLFFWLMMAVIISGMIGMSVYLSLPRRLSAIRKTRSRAEILEELEGLELASLERAADCSESISMAVRTALEQTRVGGSVARQLLGRDRSSFEEMTSDGGIRRSNQDQQRLLRFLSEQATQTRDAKETTALRHLMSLTARRQDLLRRVRRDVQIQGWLQAWLYVHVPLSIAVLLALVVHIVVVFWYW